MGSLIKKRRKRMRKKKHKKMLKRTAGSAARRQVAHRSAARHADRPPCGASVRCERDQAAPRRRRVERRAVDEPGRAAAGQHGRLPGGAPSRSRHPASAGSTTSAAGSRSLGPSAAGPPSASHAR